MLAHALPGPMLMTNQVFALLFVQVIPLAKILNVFLPVQEEQVHQILPNYANLFVQMALMQLAVYVLITALELLSKTR